ncbi:N-acetyl sugar amidotransferase [Flavobacteriaceae bacterium]|nr:N-acetyl sugar amidotransferase [Flavobacteriaceae bacterium]
MKIKFCKRCLYSTDHPLGLTINDEGICSGCEIHEEKDFLNWDERFKKLESIVEPYRNVKGENYDCIVPVTGANDSYFIINVVKNLLGLNPLLVTYNKYFNTPLGIKNLSNLRIQFNCDIIYQNINPISVKKITRKTLREYGNIYWPILAGQTVFPVQSAARFKIPLIIWGAHQGIEQVGMFSHEHEVEMTRRYRKDHDLFNLEADNVISIHDDLQKKDLWQYQYPTDLSLNNNKIRGIYLGNYIRWDPKAQHEEMIDKFGYLTSKFNRTFDCYDYVDCYNYMNLHDILKLYKHGYSKVTDHATREIRHGRLSRKEGMDMVKKYELNEPEYINLFLDWLGIEKKGLSFILDQFRNEKYWIKTGPRKWKFNGWSKSNKISGNLDSNSNLKFIENNNLNYDKELCEYITFGKGYP